MVGLILLITGIWLVSIGHPVFGGINIVCCFWLEWAGWQIKIAMNAIDEAIKEIK